MNAPFDGRFKGLAEDHPELLLRLLGIIGPGTKIEPENIIRELQLDTLHVDHLYRIEANGAPRMVHFEAITKWSSGRIPTLALYNFLIKHKYKLPVSSYVVLMAEKYVPKAMPVAVVYEEEDGFRVTAPYNVIRLWDLDPAIAFEHGCEALLPWVPLLKGGVEEFQRATDAIARFVDHPEEAPYAVNVMVSSIASLATLRYDKDAVKHFLQRLTRNIMVSKEELKVSWLYQDGLADGLANGLANGLAEGEAKGIRSLRTAVRLALGQKFPNLGSAPEIERVDCSEKLSDLLLEVLKAETAEVARTAIRAAATPELTQ